MNESLWKQLKKLLKDDDFTVTKRLVDDMHDINAQDSDGNTVLHLALQMVGMDIINLVLSKKPNVNVQNDTGNTALLELFSSEKCTDIQSTLNTLLALGADTNHKNNAGDSALSYALRNCYPKAAQTLLENGATFNYNELSSGESLLIAILLQDRATIKELLLKESNVLQNGLGEYALSFAVFKETNTELIELLLSHNAKINHTKNNNHLPPLHAAALLGKKDIIELLLDTGAYIDFYGNGKTALMFAIENGVTDVVDYLLAKGANPTALWSETMLCLKTIIDIAKDNNRNEILSYFETLAKKDITFAVFMGNVGAVKTLIENGMDVNALNLDGDTLLHVLHYCQSMDSVLRVSIAELFLKAGFDLTARYNNTKENTILHHAISWNNTDLVELYLRYGADIEAQNSNGDTALLCALNYSLPGRIYNDMIILLLKHKANIHVRTSYSNESPLSDYLNKMGINDEINLEVLQLFLAAGTDVFELSIGIHDRFGTSILRKLISADEFGDGNLVYSKLLLQVGFDVHAKDYKGENVLFACKKIETLQLFIEHGADIHTKNTANQTLLYNCNYNAFRSFLLEQKLDINAKDSGGYTPLMHFMYTREEFYLEDEAQFFVDNGAKVNEQSNDGYTALHLAVMRGDHRGVEFLLNNEADVNLKNNEGKTALHLATKWKSTKIIELLVEHNADINATDNDGNTPLHLATIESFTLMGRVSNVAGVKKLIVNNANIHAINNNGESVSMYIQSYNVLDVFLEAGMRLTDTLPTGDSLLRRALVCNNSSFVEELLENGFDYANEDSDVHLALAVKENNIAQVETLLEKEPDLLTRGLGKIALPLALNNYIPLALDNENFSLALILLKYDVDPNSWWNYQYMSPLDIALGFWDFGKEQEKILELLLEKGGDIYREDDGGVRSIDYVTNKDILAWLSEKGYDINKRSRKEQGNLFYSSTAEELAEDLKYNSNINLQNARGETALFNHASCNLNKDSLGKVELLLKHKANPNIENNSGETVLGKVEKLYDYYSNPENYDSDKQNILSEIKQVLLLSGARYSARDALLDLSKEWKEADENECDDLLLI